MRTTEMYCTQQATHTGGLMFWAFYPNTGCVRMHEPEKIFKVRVTEDREIAVDYAYWGWWENRDNRFVHVYPKHGLLDMCFPYGMKAEELRGRGHGLPVRIDIIEEIPKERW